MKHLKLALFFLSAFVFSSGNAQTEMTSSVAANAEQIINQHIEAMGGAEAWRKVTSIRIEGSMQVNGAEVSIIRTALHQKGFRMDISVAGMYGFTILNDSAGWKFAPWEGQTEPEQMTEEEVKEDQPDLDAQGELLDYKDKGSTVELMGNEEVEGKNCYNLLVTFKSGKTETLFIDTGSYLLNRTITKHSVNGQEIEVITDFGNYELQPEGIQVAKSIRVPQGELTVEKVEINKPVDESIFKPSY